jgi:hypothetical protein
VQGRREEGCPFGWRALQVMRLEVMVPELLVSVLVVSVLVGFFAFLY